MPLLNLDLWNSTRCYVSYSVLTTKKKTCSHHLYQSPSFIYKIVSLPPSQPLNHVTLQSVVHFVIKLNKSLHQCFITKIWNSFRFILLVQGAHLYHALTIKASHCHHTPSAYKVNWLLLCSLYAFMLNELFTVAAR